ncbi:OLC1v1026937C2 [Oldenlandia corymbosa var. corymbosa]|nr:OLC1v1026937C2 [Oldenlandia corymbosa var. corymbosa]
MRMYRARTRKRVNAIRRGPDGSAFQQCERCGFSVAIALADMHECESNDKVKKFRGWPRGGSPKTTLNYEDQPRSAFRFFMEEFVEECEEEDEVVVDRKGFEKWKKMSKEDREQYVIKAEKVNLAYIKALLEEENNIFWVDDEADSAEVGKFDKNYPQGDYSDDDCHISESFLFWSENSDDYGSTDW